jgi:hypothetical protein
MIWIAQILCPERHCILASAFDDKQRSRRQVMAQLVVAVEQMVANGTIDRECVICGSAAWRVESGRTNYATMDAARPELERLERENDATRRFFTAVRGMGR